MILIGQYDSPFVRRVGIALTLYGLPFEHRPWSTFGDAEKIRPYNPLMRVPTLVLDDGGSIFDSHCILDYLDGLVGPERALFPATEPLRHRVLRVATLATGLADKVVSLFYEQRLHAAVSEAWVVRCRTQILGVLEWLEAERAAIAGETWFANAGFDRLTHADIAVAVVVRFVNEAHPGLVPMTHFPALAAHAARLEATPAFQAIQQAFIPPT